ncbi:MAG: phospholipase D-like domain-containing protein [Chloroflexia bacterium]
MFRKLILRTVLAVAGVQGLLVAALLVLDSLRKRRKKPDGGFPWRKHQDVQLESSEDSLRLYTHGDVLYAAMLDEIERAQHSIYVEMYIWKSDEVGRRFVAALERKASEGVEVYVIFDWFANLVVPSWFKRFPEPIHTLIFHPVSSPVGLLDPRNLARDHRKFVVVDGRIGYVGGFNIGSLYTRKWRDTQVRIEGPGVSEMTNAFIDIWNTNRTPDLPEIAPQQGRNWNPTVQLHRNDPYLRIFPIRGVYLESIDRAEKRVYMTHAYFIPDRAFRAALKNAVQRGVDVQVLLPWNSNHVVADWLARRFFSELMRAGVRILSYQDIMIHSKTATIDGVWSTVGTANMDRLSLLGNYEVNLEVYSERFAREMESMFELDKTNSIELTLKEWEQRPAIARLVERTLQLLGPLV